MATKKLDNKERNMLNQSQQQAQQWIDEKSGQKVGIWPDRTNGGYIPRFFVDDYQPKDKKHSQRSYRKFKTAKEAKKFCRDICELLTPETAGKEKIITAIVKTYFKENKS
tara:strand:- start:86 stop:415 length:330 start_codon:yes stop_codon:yes gene_type:complete